MVCIVFLVWFNCVGCVLGVIVFLFGWICFGDVDLESFWCGIEVYLSLEFVK